MLLRFSIREEIFDRGAYTDTEFVKIRDWKDNTAGFPYRDHILE